MTEAKINATMHLISSILQDIRYKQHQISLKAIAFEYTNGILIYQIDTNRIIDTMTPTELELNNLAASAKEYSIANKEETLNKESSNGKFQRTYNQKEAAKATNVDPRYIVEEAIKLDIDCQVAKNKYLFTADEIAYINMELNSKVVRGAGTFPAVWCVTQQKGGCCKTTWVITIATGIAAECLNHYRVAVIDCDPQGTATRYLKPNFNESHLSVGDLLTGNYDSDTHTFEEACKSAFYATNHPNLDVLCAREHDRYYETHVETKRLEANKADKEYTSFPDLARIIDAVKDDYDMIFIDTTPYFSAMTYSAHYAANNLVAPVQATENDLDGFEKYTRILAESYSVLSETGHQGYKNIIVQPANVQYSNVQKETLERMRYDTFLDNCSPHDFVHSDAVLNISKEFCTIYDQSASQYTEGTQASLRRAQDLTMPLLKDIEARSLAMWSK